MKPVSFWVSGMPVTQGSSDARVNPKTGRAFVVSVKRGGPLGAWRDAIATEARSVFSEVVAGPVAVELKFYLPRPASRPKRERFPDRKPDADKLARAALDALTGVAFRDDAQVVRLWVGKLYAEPTQQTGVQVTVGAVDVMPAWETGSLPLEAHP